MSEANEEKPKVKLKYKIPKTVGAAIDMLMKIRNVRQEFDAKADAEREQEKLIENAIFEMFDKNTLEGARGKIAQASIKRSEVPTLKDWAKFVKQKDAIDLLQRRLSVEACRERWAAKETIPGVEAFTVIKLHLSKVK